MPLLRRAQEYLLEQILERVPAHEVAHGFTKDRSILTNAAPHVSKAFVVNLDVKDFFPSITFGRVKGLFSELGYSEQVATLMSLICTEPPRIAAEVEGRRYYVAMGQRSLPQGACTSPAITNILCRRLDRRLSGLAQRMAVAYTRYADDLTFSGDDPAIAGWLLKCVRSVLRDEGFEEHPQKTRVMRRGRRQEVTGLNVNDKPSISRRSRRELRAILHNAARHGLKSQNRENRPNFAAYLRGKVAFACMVEPDRADQWRSALAAALGEAG
jgi:retron-type reverse transcriptase